MFHHVHKRQANQMATMVNWLKVNTFIQFAQLIAIIHLIGNCWISPVQIGQLFDLESSSLFVASHSVIEVLFIHSFIHESW